MSLNSIELGMLPSPFDVAGETGTRIGIVGLSVRKIKPTGFKPVVV